MNDIPNPKTTPDGEDFDPTLDVLLREAMDGRRPPDLKHEILSQLRAAAQQSGSSAPPVVRASANQSESNALRYALMIFAAAASIFIVAILVQRQRTIGIGQPGDSELAESGTTDPSLSSPRGLSPRIPTDPNARSLAKDMPTANPSMTTRDEKSRTASGEQSSVAGVTQPRTLSTQGENSDAAPAPDTESVLLADVLNSVPPITYELRDGKQVSSDVATTLAGYWSSIGVQPTSPVSDVELSETLQRKLGVLFSLDKINDSSVVRRQITIPSNASELSRRFLQSMTNQGWGTVGNQKHAKLREAIADCFQGNSRLDDLLAQLVRGTHTASSQWYTSMSHGGRHGLVQRVASVTLNQDIRCVRCHDGFLDARGKQSDYWAFAGMMFQSLNHNNGSNRWQITAPVESFDESDRGDLLPLVPSGNVFFDAIDGRRVVVDAGVPVRWLSQSGTSTVAPNAIAESTLATWGTSLHGSRQLAGGVVNVIWRMVHGRPLTQSVADANAAPLDSKLDELHSTLSDDLVASNFDVARTLALVVTSPVTRRSIPEPYKVEAAGQMVDAETEQSFMAFAASKPFFQRRPIAARLETILATSGATLSVLKDGGALLAQPIDAGDPPASPTQETKRETGARIEIQDFPIVQSGLPAAWLSSIEDESDRLDHVCFMAGRTGIPPVAAEANDAMKEAGIDEQLRLSRIWWMIRP